MERLGLGPDVCLARNPKLVYGRMTGWGQTEDRDRTRTAGFDHHLVKPADITALQSLLTAVNE